MNCKNCAHPIEGKFCSRCGQKTNVSRINLTNFLSELSEGIFQINHGFFYTLKSLFAKPGSSINGYLKGQRKRHFKPVPYLLVLSTIYVIVARVTHQSTLIGDIISGWMQGVSGNQFKDGVPTVVQWILSNYAYTALILIPVFSLASYLSFYRYEKNYLEHIVVNAYITGQQAIFYTIFVIGNTLFDNEMLEILPLFVAITYAFYVFNQLFTEGSWWMNALRTFLTYLIYLFFSSVLLIAIMVLNDLQ